MCTLLLKMVHSGMIFVWCIDGFVQQVYLQYMYRKAYAQTKLLICLYDSSRFPFLLRLCW